MECRSDLESRVESLERSRGRWRTMSVVLAAVAIVGGSTAMKAAGPESLTLRKVVIVDADGRQRVVLSGSGLIFADEEEHPRIVMATLDNGAAAIQHFDPEGRRRIATGTFPDGGASVLHLDPGRNIRLESGTYPGGVARTTQFDASGLPRLDARTDGVGHALVQHSDPDGLPRITVGTDPAGRASVRLVDQDGTERLVDQVEADGRVSRHLNRDPGGGTPARAASESSKSGSPRG